MPNLNVGEVLVALGTNKYVQYKHLGGADNWRDVDIKECLEKVYDNLDSMNSKYQFRITPSTVIINKSECEAPSTGNYTISLYLNDLVTGERVTAVVYCYPSKFAALHTFDALTKPFQNGKN